MTFILAGVRTPRGKGSAKGALHAVPPVRLVEGLLAALGPRLAGALPDDLILGCATQTGEQGANLARSATLLVAGMSRSPASRSTGSAHRASMRSTSALRACAPAMQR